MNQKFKIIAPSKNAFQNIDFKLLFQNACLDNYSVSDSNSDFSSNSMSDSDSDSLALTLILVQLL